MRFKELRDSTQLKKIYDLRLEIIRQMRMWFYDCDFVEVDTPSAVISPDIEPHLNPVPVEFYNEHGEKNNFYLHTSPEYAMKKLLGAGYEKIFQICHCFRNVEESGNTHNPEFTMIEWYRAPGNYFEIMDDLENLFKAIGKKINVSKLQHHDIAVELNTTWERIKIKDLWQKYLGVNLDDYLTTKKMGELAAAHDLQVAPSDDFTDLFYKIFLNEIEPKLGQTVPTIIYEYPAQMAALARLCSDDNRYAERFELYAAGLEVANCFGELTDTKEQLTRFENERAQREKMDKVVLPIDKELVSALEYVPSAAGIALGVDRMVMLLTGARNINEVIFNTVADQLEK